MKPECQAKNLKGLTMVAVGVNKSAEQYLLLDEDTKAELAQGKYHDQRRGTFGQPGRLPASRGPPARRRPPSPVPAHAGPAQASATQPSAAPASPRPGQGQPGEYHPGQHLAGLGCLARRRSAGWRSLYNQQGLRPDEIARKLGLSRYDVTQIILAARSGSRS